MKPGTNDVVTESSLRPDVPGTEIEGGEGLKRWELRGCRCFRLFEKEVIEGVEDFRLCHVCGKRVKERKDEL